MRTDYLFAMPSFRSGVARVFDLFGVFDTYNDGPTDHLADARALHSDWHVVGQDLADAMTMVEREPTLPQPTDTADLDEAGRH